VEAQLPVLTPQPIKFFTLRSRQSPFAVSPRIALRPGGPVPDRLRMWSEILRQLTRRSSSTIELDDLLAEFRRVGPSRPVIPTFRTILPHCRHLQSECSGVHQTGSTPTRCPGLLRFTRNDFNSVAAAGWGAGRA